MKVFNGIYTVYEGLINLQRKHCVWMSRKDCLKRVLRDTCLKSKQLNIRGLLFYYVIMALVRALLVFCVCDCAFIVALAHCFQQVKEIIKLFSEQFKKPQIVSQQKPTALFSGVSFYFSTFNAHFSILLTFIYMLYIYIYMLCFMYKSKNE